MTNYAHGHKAEDAAAQYLQRHGYEIFDRNWRTRQCEIDIVAKKDNVVSFIEVKYRQNSSQGNGLEYVTAAKLRQMQFAADMWMSHHNFVGECTLAALEVSGPEYDITAFVNVL